jgi:hypothetical protein
MEYQNQMISFRITNHRFLQKNQVVEVLDHGRVVATIYQADNKSKIRLLSSNVENWSLTDGEIKIWDFEFKQVKK